MGRLAHYADFTSTSELPFASFSERVLVLNISHEKDLIFMRMNIQVTYIFIPIVSHKDSFCHRGKSKLGIGLFIHELLREPLILLRGCCIFLINLQGLCMINFCLEYFSKNKN